MSYIQIGEQLTSSQYATIVNFTSGLSWNIVPLQGAIDGSNRVFNFPIGSPLPLSTNSMEVRIARQPQEQTTDWTFSISGGLGRVTYLLPPDPSLAGSPHLAQYQ